MNTPRSVIDYQQRVLRAALAPLVKRGEPYALLDFPDHSNVGDSAIWLGETILLRNLFGRYPNYVCAFNTFQEAAFIKAVPHGTIFLHGGGNFGDIYPWYQQFRQDIISSYPNHRIIQLPQSIKFRSDAGISSAAAILSDHADFHLMVRDRLSTDFADQHLGLKAILSPDSAFFLGSMRRTRPVDHDALFLFRTDDEKVQRDLSDLTQKGGYQVRDWLEEPADIVQTNLRSGRLKSLFKMKLRQNDRLFEYYQALAWHRVRRGLDLLSGAKHIVTDRLHAHILSVLLDIPHVTLDNDYGKIASYQGAWTGNWPKVRAASNLNAAVKLLNDLP